MIDRLNDKGRISDWITLGLILLLAIFYILTLPSLPFHPDESTHLYMSKDLFTYFRDPPALSWDGTAPLDSEERIRAIDAPIAKYLIGGTRGLFSVPALQADWNWSASWLENKQAGALPTDHQLLVARAAITLPLVVGLWFYYLTLKRSLPGYAGAAAIVLLGLNPLVLLHSRRAMSEGVLLFSLGFFLWAATSQKRQPWLIGLAFAVALNSKHTALALLPAALYAVSLVPNQRNSLAKSGARILQFGLVAAALTILLNPFYWQQPLQALRIGLDARMSLARQQGIDHLAPGGRDQLEVGQRAAALLANTFVAAPQTEEVGNYLKATQQSRQAYLTNPVYTWGRGLIGGGILLIFTLVGLIVTALQLPSLSGTQKTNTWIWILSTLGMILILLFPLPWQRYAVPLLPLSVFWIISGLALGIKALQGDKQSS